MSCCIPDYEDRKLTSTWVVTFIVVAYGISMVAWAVIQSESTEITRQIVKGRFSFACYLCFSDTESDLPSDHKCRDIDMLKCKQEGWARREAFPALCERNSTFKSFVEQKVVEEFTKKSNHFEDKDLTTDERNYLTDAEDSFYGAVHPIVHWSPDTTSSDDKEATGWRTIKDFHHDKSTYTISAGPQHAYHRGKLRVPEMGLYLIYARLTFACQSADQEEKEVHMEIVVNERPRHHSALLRDMQRATCGQVDDLVTLFQSGIFRLNKHHAISLKYKSPANVTLSEKQSLYKSTIGLQRVGLA